MDLSQITEHIVVLAGAYALAFPIGWDREKEARSAGLRTFPLVALASCGFIEATEVLLKDSDVGVAHVVEGLITGMGFIGGGAILKHGSSVYGTATAASRSDRRRGRTRQLRGGCNDLSLHFPYAEIASPDQGRQRS